MGSLAGGNGGEKCSREWPFDVEELHSTVIDYVGQHTRLMDAQTREDAFFVVNLGQVVVQLKLWRELLPRVEPFYGEDLINDC